MHREKQAKITAFKLLTFWWEKRGNQLTSRTCSISDSGDRAKKSRKGGGANSVCVCVYMHMCACGMVSQQYELVEWDCFFKVIDRVASLVRYH